MPTEYDTVSERIFGTICDRHGYTFSKISPLPQIKKKTADFRVVTPEIQFIAEIKELTPNEDDLRTIEEMREKGFANGGSIVGKRAREAIREAATQLKPYKHEKIPLIVVLYDNVRKDGIRVAYPMYYLEMGHIDAAMYGNCTATINPTTAKQTRPDRNGSGQTLTPKEKTYVSAIVTISDWDNRSLNVYHNCFATNPLPISVFFDPECVHLIKNVSNVSKPWKWEKVQR